MKGKGQVNHGQSEYLQPALCLEVFKCCQEQENVEQITKCQPMLL